MQAIPYTIVSLCEGANLVAEYRVDSLKIRRGSDLQGIHMTARSQGDLLAPALRPNSSDETACNAEEAARVEFDSRRSMTAGVGRQRNPAFAARRRSLTAECFSAGCELPC